MKERPILFNSEMVRAILDGRKTQTRRIVKPRPWCDPRDVSVDSLGFIHWTDENGIRGVGGKASPFVTVGDRLWVRETWQAWSRCNMEYDEWDVCDCAPSEIQERYGNPKVEYAATSDSVGPWRPSIHMPRWASRMTLEITGVRVERVREISEKDAESEGVSGYCPFGICSGSGYLGGDNNCQCADMTPQEVFRSLWSSTYDPDSWDRDWVWVYEFRRVQ